MKSIPIKKIFITSVVTTAMLLLAITNLNGAVFTKRASAVWPNGRIPYEISSVISATGKQTIQVAISEWNTKTGINLVPRNGEADYVRFVQGEGCQSWIGKIGGMQEISCDLSSGSYFDSGSIVHEIGHAVGLLHEHQRPDRDSYITVNYANVDPDYVDEFDLLSTQELLLTAYDYGSIMHYFKDAFSNGGGDTIATPAGQVIGVSSELSPLDIDGIAVKYPSSGPSPSLQFTNSQRWATAQGGFWDSQKWFVGDFNGDGKDDLTKVFNDNGYSTVDIHKSSGSSFGIQRAANRQGGFWDTQKWFVGDFNGDGKDDLGKVFNDNGASTVDIHQSNGNFFGIRRAFTRQGGFWDAQKWIVGDISGDGKADIGRIFNHGGSSTIDVFRSNGTTFVGTRAATQQGGFWDTQKWFSGDFNGDGKDDFGKVFNEAGSATVDIHQFNGSTLAMRTRVNRQSGYWDTQKWLSGDFNGDGKEDLAKVFNDSGYSTVDLHLSTGSSFAIQRVITRQGGFWDTQKWMVGDFNGDGKVDIVRVFGANGKAYMDVFLAGS